MLHHHRLRMREVPVRMFQRGGGVSSIRSGKSAYYMVKVLLALFVGLARARPVPEPGDAGAGRRRATGSDGDPDPDRRDRRRPRRCCSSCSRWCAAGACSSATRCCGCSAPSSSSASPSGAARWSRSPRRSGSYSPPERAVLHRARLHPRAAAALLGRGLAPGRPEQGPRAAPGARSSSSCASSRRAQRGGPRRRGLRRRRRAAQRGPKRKRIRAPSALIAVAPRDLLALGERPPVVGHRHLVHADRPGCAAPWP